MSAQDLEQRAREYQHVLDMLGVATHEEAGAEIGRLHAAALRQQPAPVDLEQFREAVECWGSHRRSGRGDPRVAAEAKRLLAIIDNHGKVASAGPVADETGPYPFGAGIEPNPKARYWQQRSAFWMAEALRLGYAPPGETPTHQPAPVVDDAMVELIEAAEHGRDQLQRALEIDQECTCEPCPQCSRDPIRCSETQCAETCDCILCDHCCFQGGIDGLTAALARAQGVQS